MLKDYLDLKASGSVLFAFCLCVYGWAGGHVCCSPYKLKYLHNDTNAVNYVIISFTVVFIKGVIWLSVW